MARPHSTYAAEFKLSAVKMITEQKLSVAEAARRLDACQRQPRSRPSSGMLPTNRPSLIACRLSIPVHGQEERLALLHAVGAAARKLSSPTRTDPAERYLTPAFTQQLLDHMHKAKKNALAEAKEE